MSSTPTGPPAGRGGPDERGVPSYDPTLFDDPDEPASPSAPVATSAPNAAPAPTPTPTPTPAAGSAVTAAPSGSDAGPDGVEAVSGVRPARPVDTGRLYRSAGAEGPLAAEAIPALSTDELAVAPAAGVAAGAVAAPSAGQTAIAEPARPLPTGPAAAAEAAEAIADDADAEASATDAEASASESPAPASGWVPVVGSAAGVAAAGGAHADAAPDDEATTDGAAPTARDEPATADARPGGLTWTGVAVVMTVVTVALAFAQVLILPGQSFWVITGVGYLLATVYCALTVRPTDLWAAFVVPPLAWLLGVLTAGQLTLEGSGSLLVREGTVVFVGLAFNAPFLIGGAVVALVIILVRRARARRAGVI